MKKIKSKIRGWIERAEKHRVGRMIFGAMRTAWSVVSHNLGLKLLSLVVAVLLWNFVVTSNTSITRTKTLSNLTGYISGQSTLETYGLSLLENPSDALSNISVQIDVSQSEYAKPSAANVQVTLDLSRVRSVGTQEVPLKATTSYGRVVRIIPESLTLTFESLDSRLIPVNVQISGEKDKKSWYNVSRSNPSVLTISGASSVVQSIASAYAYVDVTDEKESFIAAEKYVLLDSDGNEIPQSMLNRSSSSISVSVDVYPTEDIPVSTDLANVVTGQVKPGYVIESVTIQPDKITVAAEEELLAGLTELHIEPISVEGLSQSIAARAKLTTLSAFKYVSADEVYVSINIAEEKVGAWIESVSVNYMNKSENIQLSEEVDTIRVYVTGPRSVIATLQDEGFTAAVDLENVGEGVQTLPIIFPTEAYPDVVFTPEVGEVKLTLIKAGETSQ